MSDDRFLVTIADAGSLRKKYGDVLMVATIRERLRTIHAAHMMGQYHDLMPRGEMNVMLEIKEHLDSIRKKENEDAVLKAEENLRAVYADYVAEFGDYRAIVKRIVTTTLKRHTVAEEDLEYIRCLISLMRKEGIRDKTGTMLLEQLLFLYENCSGDLAIIEREDQKTSYKEALSFVFDAMVLLGLSPKKRNIEKQVERLAPNWEGRRSILEKAFKKSIDKKKELKEHSW
ncbi:hypothetical protein [Solemya elarraichensis gill symbiont]|uniref:Uncharacterized protein n=1 Tax=Solemya elarraichensis gill symbiont TaxID=1918949 RepID=A0A1T2KV01_9GAMM|nr:hypothetical protein [Solemya elarraichensis gill symbiont]OOZ36546.1 hypothetical protein BOW52_10715 [Solemya elarraichensis gill symbiont]